MKRVMKLFCLISLVFSMVFIFLISLASAASITASDVNSTLTTVNITNAQNLYSYEVTFAYTGTISSAVSYGFLSSDGAAVTDIAYSLRAGNVSVYESRLDNTKAGISGAGNLFNITHSGSLTLKSLLTVSKDGQEETTNYNADGTTIVTIITVSGGGGGGGVTVQHYAIKIVSPGDVTLPKEGIIQVPVTIQNPGNVALKGIKLSANVSFNNFFSEDIQISLEQTEIAEIAAGASKEMLITITANTKKQGIYKITVYADVDSPKFSDWGEFYVEFKKTSESEADNAISTAEILISENPECLELTEIVNEAKAYLESREFTKSAAKVQEFTDACDKAIAASKPKSVGIKLDEKIIYYSIIITAVTLAVLIGFYIYRRLKYKKLKGNYS